MRGKFIAGCVLVFVPAALFAADAQVDAARRCAQQKDSLQRLVCYDGIFQAADPAPAAQVPAAAVVAPAAAVAAAPAAATAAAVAPVAAAPAAAAPAAVAPAVAAAAVVAAPPAAAPAVAVAPARALGDEAVKKPSKEEKASEPKNLEAKVTVTRETRPELFRVTLDNGQTWQQQDVSSLFHVSTGDTVRIEKGSMGSYRMARVTGGSSSGWVRVKRVQ